MPNVLQGLISHIDRNEIVVQFGASPNTTLPALTPHVLLAAACAIGTGWRYEITTHEGRVVDVQPSRPPHGAAEVPSTGHRSVPVAELIDLAASGKQPVVLAYWGPQIESIALPDRRRSAERWLSQAISFAERGMRPAAFRAFVQLVVLTAASASFDS
jgi:hypothetical protein